MLDRNSSTPLYIQLDDILRSHIHDRTWPPLHMIPSENELSKQYGISRMTVRAVITSMVSDGLLYRVQGKGTFVAEPKISAKSPAYVGIREQLEGQGYNTDTKLLVLEKVMAGSKVGRLLTISPDTSIWHSKRLRYADNIPVSIHESYIPCSLCESLSEDDLEQYQLCKILEKNYHLSPQLINESLESISATDSEAKLLGIARGYPLLLMEEISQTSQNTKFEYSKIIFRGDKIKIEFQYNLS